MDEGEWAHDHHHSDPEAVELGVHELDDAEASDGADDLRVADWHTVRDIISPPYFTNCEAAAILRHAPSPRRPGRNRLS